MKQFKIRGSATGQIMCQKALGDTGKGYVENWIKEQIYSRKKEFSTKETDKGIKCEWQGIELASDYFGWGMVDKNEEYFENEYMTGTPDLILGNMVVDIKCPWDCFTFPLFETEPAKAYYYQLQTYMALTGKQKGMVAYCLMNAPSEMIDQAAWIKCKSLGFDEVVSEVYDQVEASMTYDNVPLEYRIKTFEVERDEAVIQKIRDRVIECREYIKTIELPVKLQTA